MFSIGMRAEAPREFYRGVQGKVIFRVLLANVVLVPLVAWFIHHLIPMRPEHATAFMLVAITPGGLFGLHFCHIAKGQISFAIQLAFLLALAAMLMVPLIAGAWLPVEVAARFLDLRILIEMFVFAFLPLVLGQVLRQTWCEGAKILGKFLLVLNPVLFATQEFVGSQVKDISMKSVGHPLLLAFALLVLACWLIGWLLGGPDVGRRKVLAIDTSMRNAAICWLLVHRSFAEIDVSMAILAFNGLAVPMNFTFAIVGRLFLGKGDKK